MCGIAGIWNRDGRPVEPGSIERMNAVQRHRGPDGDGVMERPGLAFGHCRLAIVDTGTGGHQPRVSRDGSLWVTFNGEIHNHLELRAELVHLGAEFASSAETEILLHGYRQWKFELFERINGMWAVALWDESARELVLSRDRFGIKPLFVAEDGPTLAFASEVKALLSHRARWARPDRNRIVSFLAGASPDGTGSTFFREVRSVEAATTVCMDREGHTRVHRYWSPPQGPTVPRDDAPEELRTLLEDAVRLRLRADVPVGACLSGGLDSSSVVTLAQRHVDHMHCFSLRTADPRLDESGFARDVVADLPGVAMHWVEPDEQGMLDVIERIVWHHDAPTPSRGRYPQWFVLQAAGREVKVVVDGQGADELLAGYSNFRLPHALDTWAARSSKGPFAAALASLHCAGHILSSDLRPTLLAALARRAGRAVAPASDLLRPDALAEPLDMEDFRDAFLHPALRAYGQGHLERALRGEFLRSGLPELLHAEDALGMAASVEARPAFLDHRLVEFCFGLPYDEKIREGWRKSVLRRAMDGILPERVCWRRDKSGYPVPLDRWLRQADNARRICDLLLSPNAHTREFLVPRKLEKFVQRWRTRGLAGYALELLWRCVTLELWFRRDQSTTPSGSEISSPP